MMGSAVSAMTTGYAGTPCEIEVSLNKVEGRKAVTMRDRTNQTVLKAPVFMDGEDVKGTVSVNLSKGKKLDHQGIRVELIGQLENLVDAKQSSTFLQLVRDLEPPGALTDNVSYPFEFRKAEK
jgi:vacuolar protein sorting-associated protein 26